MKLWPFSAILVGNSFLCCVLYVPSAPVLVLESHPGTFADIDIVDVIKGIIVVSEAAQNFSTGNGMISSCTHTWSTLAWLGW